MGQKNLLHKWPQLVHQRVELVIKKCLQLFCGVKRHEGTYLFTADKHALVVLCTGNNCHSQKTGAFFAFRNTCKHYWSLGSAESVASNERRGNPSQVVNDSTLPSFQLNHPLTTVASLYLNFGEPPLCFPRGPLLL